MGVAAKVTQPRHESQLPPHVPWRRSPEKTPPVCGRQRLDLLQVHFNACGERRLDFIQGISEGRYVEVDADRLPHRAGPIGVTVQCSVHAHFHEYRMSEDSGTRQGYTGSPSLCQRSDCGRREAA